MPAWSGMHHAALRRMEPIAPPGNTTSQRSFGRVARLLLSAKRGRAIAMLLLDTLIEMVATMGEFFGLMLQSLLPSRRPAWRAPAESSKIS